MRSRFLIPNMHLLDSKTHLTGGIADGLLALQYDLFQGDQKRIPERCPDHESVGSTHASDAKLWGFPPGQPPPDASGGMPKALEVTTL
jgi:hypothetical protein